MELTTNELFELFQTKNTLNNIKISSISTDSRKIKENDVFIAIKGEQFDGHDYVKDVIKNGAVLAIVEHLISDVDPSRQIVVPSSLDAYGQIGAYMRSKFKGTVIGLTGSAGKTTTKEELKFLLSHFGKTYATLANHNNFIGVPQSLCELDLTADYAIIEMGMSARGEIEKLVSYVKPDIALVTNVFPMHIEFLKTLQNIARAKAEIFSALSSNSIAVINADTNCSDILESIASEHTKHIYLFGKNHLPNVPFETQETGENHFYNALACLKVIEALGLDVQKAATFIKDFGALEGRGKKHLLHLSKDATYTLINDSYSGQPEAMKLAIRALENTPSAGRKIAVLGKMAELGDFSKEAHRQIGEELSQTHIDIVIGVCEEMKDMLSLLPQTIKQYYFESKEGIVEFLLNELLQNDDILLIKGARYSSKLYQVADELIKKGTL